MTKLNSKVKFGIGLFLFCCGYWLLDSLWVYLSFEKNLSYLIFREPMSYFDTLLLNVSPYQAVSRLMVIVIFIVTGTVAAYFFQKQKKAENTARLQRDYLNTLLETVPNPVFYKDTSARYSGCNSAYEKYIGQSRGLLIGQSVYDVAADNLADVHNKFDQELLETPGVRHYESTATRSDGERRDVIFDKATIVTNDGQIEGLIGILTDITDLKRTEAEKVQLERQLVQAQKLEALGTLAGGIAHDFNNILYGIMGFAELCLDDAAPGSLLHENLQEIQSGCKRAKALIKQILAFSKHGNDQFQVVPMAEIVKEASKLMSATIPGTISLKVDLAAENSTIKCDPTQIHQVIMNLCTNAVHAMAHQGGTLTIRLADTELSPEEARLSPEHHTAGRYLQLTVRDTGCGIPLEIRNRIFDPFFTSKAQGQGTGMGLAMVHGIVRAHSGFIVVKSEADKFTAFEIYFPLVASTAS
jgi:two-component system, cell cycle sensor histidine kinase and response regulator CckA